MDKLSVELQIPRTRQWPAWPAIGWLALLNGRTLAPVKPDNSLTICRRGNALWCADYKGEFMLGNRRYCYPLTITDFGSRYLLTCEALATTQEQFAFTVFERTFKDFGLPQVIRTDNGLP